MQYRSVVFIAGALAACSPTLDWREFEPEGSHVRVTFPCKPDRYARNVVVAGVETRMEMVVCTAGDATFALSFVDVADPAAVVGTLAELRAGAARNVGDAAPKVIELRVSGMTPNPQAARLQLSGRRPDGAALQQQAAFFSKGLRVYQASIVGTQLPAELLETFFSGLKLPS